MIQIQIHRSGLWFRYKRQDGEWSKWVYLEKYDRYLVMRWNLPAVDGL